MAVKLARAREYGDHRSRGPPTIRELVPHFVHAPVEVDSILALLGESGDHPGHNRRRGSPAANRDVRSPYCEFNARSTGHAAKLGGADFTSAARSRSAVQRSCLPAN